MDVVILTEASQNRGYGHVVRCFALQEAFRHFGVDAVMWVDSDQPIVDSIITGSDYKITNWKEAIDRVLPSAGTGPKITIVDSYEANRPLLDAIALRSQTCCFFDDTARLDYPQGILVNAAIDADSLYPDHGQGRQYLTGPRYAVLRKEFWINRPYVLRERIEKVLVVLGSCVPRDKIYTVAMGIKDVLETKAITVIHESAGEQRDEVGTVAIRWMWGLRPEEFINLVLQSDLAVCSGGQALLELACLGVPTVSVTTANNQQSNVAGFESAGFAIHAGPLASRNCLERLRHSLAIITSAKERAQRSAVGRRLVDGQGALRVARAIAGETP